ncbi:putative cell wall amidase lytH [Philodulcilactobacillus myokoensis]|uniref:Cell wall amidase lytH n=1 Tax=Philodulcilactobacillus myokoensis TaxID=2929573 RepID=A0A9W6ESE2_9LACO|nr:N-acetylmuramoyl-L-alanine amidase [Philodulcilactobacillus myokoensis]GLB46059.1 putative cell wall amidase lytH [Philodulcilactobacillus myokoensis]
MEKLTHFKDAPLIIWILRILLLISVIMVIIIKISSYLSEPRVIAQSVNLRTNPNPQSKIINQIPHNTRIKVIQKDNTTKWWYIKDGKQKGWIAAWLLKNEDYNSKKASNISEATIVLDPGHGGNDSGTLSQDGKMEKTYTLPVAKKVLQLIKAQNSRVIISRTSDQSVSLGARTRLSNQNHANVFISFHFNSSEIDEGDNGYEVFKDHDNANRLANQLDSGFSDLPLNNRGVDIGNYYVLRENTQPAVLIEMGFMNNPSDFEHIKSNDYQQKVADDVEQSLQKYFK